MGTQACGAAGLTQDARDAILPRMNAEPRHPLLPPEGMSDAEWDAIRDAQADADIAAGRLIPHEMVKEWARKLGTPHQMPMPREWLE